MATKKAKTNWAKTAFNPEKKGALHRSLGVPEDKKIPLPKLEVASHSKNGTTRKRANLALRARKFKHK